MQQAPVTAHRIPRPRERRYPLAGLHDRQRLAGNADLRGLPVDREQVGVADDLPPRPDRKRHRRRVVHQPALRRHLKRRLGAQPEAAARHRRRQHRIRSVEVGGRQVARIVSGLELPTRDRVLQRRLERRRHAEHVHSRHERVARRVHREPGLGQAGAAAAALGQVTGVLGADHPRAILIRHDRGGEAALAVRAHLDALSRLLCHVVWRRAWHEQGEAHRHARVRHRRIRAPFRVTALCASRLTLARLRCRLTFVAGSTLDRDDPGRRGAHRRVPIAGDEGVP